MKDGTQEAAERPVRHSAPIETACRDGGHVDGLRARGLVYPGKRSIHRAAKCLLSGGGLARAIRDRSRAVQACKQIIGAANKRYGPFANSTSNELSQCAVARGRRRAGSKSKIEDSGYTSGIRWDIRIRLRNLAQRARVLGF
jgi:hypothetical protein